MWRRARLECLESRQMLSVAMSGYEQLLLYLTNRARSDPAAEAARLGIDLNEGLNPGTISTAAKPPLAPHEALITAAGDHAQDMLDNDFFDHVNLQGQTPPDRAVEAGYPTSIVGENIAWGGTTGTLDTSSAVYQRHDSLFRSPDHRQNMLLAGYREAGMGVRFGTYEIYNAVMVAESFGVRSVGPVLTGVVYRDLNGNRDYDLGEGISGVTITVGAWSTTTNAAGGWDLLMPGSGSYTVTANGGGVAALATVDVVQSNLEVDFLVGQDWGIVDFRDQAPPNAAEDRYIADQGTALVVAAADGVLDNDTPGAGGPLTASLVAGPAHGSLTLSANGSFTYTPQSGYTGLDSFTYAAVENGARSTPATVSLVVAEPLESLDFAASEGLDLAAADAWFRVETVRDGLLTLQIAPTAGGTAQATLYSLAGNQLALSAPAGGLQRIDHAATAGTSYLVKLHGTSPEADFLAANLIAFNPAGTEASVHGTADADTFTAALDGLPEFSINGVDYSLGEATALSFFGGGSQDTAVVTGSTGVDEAELSPLNGVILGPSVRVELHETASITFHGGGGADRVRLVGSSGDDVLVAGPNYGGISGPGFANEAHDVASVVADAGTGGVDVAKLYDSPGNDLLLAGPIYAGLSGNGFALEAHRFDGVHAYATAGGRDEARLYDSAGNDTFYGDTTQGALYGDGFYNRAKFFEGVHAYATAGGHDSAELHDSPGDDAMFGSSVDSALYGEGFYNRVKFFEEIHAWADGGGVDVAKLYDSPGDDELVAGPTTAVFTSDRLHRLEQFDGVHVYSTAGGHDIARLSGSDGDDRFHADPSQAALYGAGFYNRAKFFDEVFAEAGSLGYDQAELYDSASVDLLEARDDWARLSHALDWLFEASRFDYVRAVAGSAGNTRDTAPLDTLLFELVLDGPWQE